MQRSDELDPVLFSSSVGWPHLERKSPAFLEYLSYASEQPAMAELRETGMRSNLLQARGRRLAGMFLFQEVKYAVLKAAIGLFTSLLKHVSR